jgi:hypothetical protein
MRGLQTLLAEGHVVDAVVKLCGAAGHVLDLARVPICYDLSLNWRRPLVDHSESRLGDLQTNW